MYEESIQFHLWPWSAIGCSLETTNVTGKEAQVQYYGSPVLSIPQGFHVNTDVWHEDFLPLGCSYQDNKYQLYLVPHAVAASRQPSGKDGAMKLHVYHAQTHIKIGIRTIGAVSGRLSDDGELQQAIRQWMSFFDFCVQKAKAKEKGAASIPWKELYTHVLEYGNDPNVQKRSLIVSIAEKMAQLVQELVNSARKILIHERKLLPAAKVSEMDTGCMLWYFRQPGRTTAQKASTNKQRLQGMSRRETFNTLENRVLKDFLLRCVRECRQYIHIICNGTTDSGCAKEVSKYGIMCSELLKRPLWQDVDNIEGGVRPNYVLQNDTRYRKIWRFYQKLLRKQEEEDWMWAWQGRTWGDICILLISIALLSMENNDKNSVHVKLLHNSECTFLNEQIQGSRILTGSEPGPFILSWRNQIAILEIVHAEQAGKHKDISTLGSTGGRLFFVVKQIGKSNNVARTIVIWPVHCLASTYKYKPHEILLSAERGLKCQSQFLNWRYQTVSLTGLVIADAFFQGEPDFYTVHNTYLASLAADPRLWEKNIAVLTDVLNTLFIALLGDKNE